MYIYISHINDMQPCTYIGTYIFIMYLCAFHNCYRKIHTPQNVDKRLLDVWKRPNESGKIQLYTDDTYAVINTHTYT